MSKYESVIILKPDIGEKNTNKIVGKIENKIAEFATVTEKQDLGIRKLAYEIKNNKEGHYYIYQFELNEGIKKEVIKDIEFFFKIIDEVIKSIVVKKEGE